MNCKELEKRDRDLLLNLMKDLDIDFDLDYMLENFFSIIKSVKAGDSRFRIIGVVKSGETKKTNKRIAVFSISSKELDEVGQLRIKKAALFVETFKHLRTLFQLNELEESMELISDQITYQTGVKLVQI